MRTIKFRGKDIDTGEWLCGDLLQPLGHYPAIVVHHPNEQGKVACSVMCVQRDTVGQFTGLCDCYARPIYEGDILMFRDEEDCNDTLVVMWDKGSFVAENTNRSDRGCRICSNYFAVEPKLFRVVGNIHDNPELLKGGSDEK